MKTHQEDINQENIIQSLKEQNKHLLDRLEKSYEKKSELRRKLYLDEMNLNNPNGKSLLNTKRGDPTKESTD